MLKKTAFTARIGRARTHIQQRARIRLKPCPLSDTILFYRTSVLFPLSNQIVHSHHRSSTWCTVVFQLTEMNRISHLRVELKLNSTPFYRSGASRQKYAKIADTTRNELPPISWTTRNGRQFIVPEGRCHFGRPGRRCLIPLKAVHRLARGRLAAGGSSRGTVRLGGPARRSARRPQRPPLPPTLQPRLSAWMRTRRA